MHFFTDKGTLPSDINVFQYIYCLHNDEKIYNNPNKYDPDRFLLSNVADRHAYAYVPFSSGARNCIGKNDI